MFLVFDLRDLDDLEKRLFKLSWEGKKLFRKDFYLTAKPSTHIIERYYHKIARHPETRKFTIQVPDLLALLKQTRRLPTTPTPGRDGIYREVDTGKIIGYDRAGRNASFVTLISHPQGRSEIAFSGIMELRHSNIQADGHEEQNERSV